MILGNDFVTGGVYTSTELGNHIRFLVIGVKPGDVMNQLFYILLRHVEGGPPRKIQVEEWRVNIDTTYDYTRDIGE